MGDILAKPHWWYLSILIGDGPKWAPQGPTLYYGLVNMSCIIPLVISSSQLEILTVLLLWYASDSKGNCLPIVYLWMVAHGFHGWYWISVEWYAKLLYCLHRSNNLSVFFSWLTDCTFHGFVVKAQRLLGLKNLSASEFAICMICRVKTSLDVSKF